MINIFLFSLYLCFGFSNSLNRYPENPSTGKFFEIGYKKMMDFSLYLSEIEIEKESRVYLRIISFNLGYRGSFRRIFYFKSVPGICYGYKAKSYLKEGSFFPSFTFGIFFNKRVTPFILLRTFYDMKDFFYFMELGIGFNL